MRDDSQALLGLEIGHIRVVDVLGEGGMGTVYLGFDGTLQRKVAVKAIRDVYRLRADTKARFLREARILSQIAHPNICVVHDFVEGDDNDFLVLELVEGRNLREAMKEGFSDQQKMTIARQLLEVLVAVHGQGVIHRDLKPENVMVASSGQVKVLDFGLARSIQEDSLISPVVGSGADSPEVAAGRSTGVETRLGAVVGTLGYMSPEQACGEPATPASDMYSLGLILQELFTGQRPLPTGLPPQALLLKAAQGDTTPVTGLATDLTALINRLKSVAPGARPSSLDAAEQLQRIIDKPRLRRRRRLVAAVWLSLALLSIGMTVQSIRAARQARRAEQEAATAQRVSDFLVDLFEVSDPGEARGSTITAREVLDTGADRIERGLEQQPLIQARLMTTMGDVYQKLGLYERSVAQLEAAARTRQELLGEDHVDVATTLRKLANAYLRQSRHGEAEALYRRALAITEKVLGPDHPDVAVNLNNLAVLCRAQARHDEAETLYRDSLAITEEALGPDHPDVARTLANLGILLYVVGRYDDARPLHVRALAIREAAFGSDHPALAQSLTALAELDSEQGRYDVAERLYQRALAIRERALGPDHPEVAASLQSLAQQYAELGRHDDAESLHSRALAIREAALGRDHPVVATSLANVADGLARRGELVEAERLLRRALAIIESAFGPDHPRTANCLHDLASLYTEQRRFAEAEPLYRRALASYESAFGSEHRTVAMALTNLARLLREAGRYKEAEPLGRRGLAVYEGTLGPDHPYTAFSLVNLARLLRDQGRLDEAEPLLARALAVQEEILGPTHDDVVATLGEYADLLRAMGRSDRAAELEALAEAARAPAAALAAD